MTEAVSRFSSRYPPIARAITAAAIRRITVILRLFPFPAGAPVPLMLFSSPRFPRFRHFFQASLSRNSRRISPSTFPSSRMLSSTENAFSGVMGGL